MRVEPERSGLSSLDSGIGALRFAHESKRWQVGDVVRGTGSSLSGALYGGVAQREGEYNN